MSFSETSEVKDDAEILFTIGISLDWTEIISVLLFEKLLWFNKPAKRISWDFIARSLFGFKLNTSLWVVDLKSVNVSSNTWNEVAGNESIRVWKEVSFEISFPANRIYYLMSELYT